MSDKKRMLTMDYPGNKKTEELPEKKVTQITKGVVKKQKKSLGKKFLETFLGDDIESVSAYLIHDVIVPAAKNMMSDTVSNGVEMLLFGQVRGSRTARSKNKSYVSYGNMYQDRPQAQSKKTQAPRNRARHNFDDIILEGRGEAEEVLSCLVDLCEDYGEATVADLYDLVGMTSNFTDNKYGWDNLSQATIQRVRDGYLIGLPKTIVLD